MRAPPIFAQPAARSAASALSPAACFWQYNKARQLEPPNPASLPALMKTDPFHLLGADQLAIKLLVRNNQVRNDVVRDLAAKSSSRFAPVIFGVYRWSLRILVEAAASCRIRSCTSAELNSQSSKSSPVAKTKRGIIRHRKSSIKLFARLMTDM